MKVLRALLSNLSKSIFRDSFMLFIFSIPLFVTILFRVVLPILNLKLLQYFALSDYYEFIAQFLLLLGPMLFGMVTGFNLLDERDENILIYMSITPIRRRGYLVFKILIPMVFTMVQSIMILFIFDLGNADMMKIIPLVMICAIETPIYALLMASFAGNKVEGLAIGKLAGIGMIAPFISFFVHSNWKYLAGIFPTFWITEAYFSLTPFRYLVMVTLGIVIHLFYLVLTYNVFLNRSN